MNVTKTTAHTEIGPTDLEATTVEEESLKITNTQLAPRPTPKINISIPTDLELTKSQIGPKGITGKGWTMRRKFPKVGRNDPCPCGGDHKFKNHVYDESK